MSFFACLRLPVFPTSATGVQLSGLVSGFPLMCLPLWLMVSGSPHVSLHLSPFICFPVWPVVFPILAGVIWLCLSLLYVPSSMCLPLWLVLSGCPDVFSLLSLVSHHLCASICFPAHLFPNLFVFNDQSALVVVLDSFIYAPLCLFSIVCFSPSVSHFTCLPIQMSPLMAVSCSCFITISCMNGPYTSSFHPLRLPMSQGSHILGP